MIHRGVQYSRAIRAYYKKFGRYPVKIEDLENTNRQRFLRKRYKDPLNCKESKCEDFKLLHFGEVQMTLSAMGGGVIPGATPAGAIGSSPTSAFGGSSGSTNSNSTFGQSAQTGSDPSAAGIANLRDWNRPIESVSTGEQPWQQPTRLWPDHWRSDCGSRQRQHQQRLHHPGIQSQEEI
jgi:hypothetical protein